MIQTLCESHVASFDSKYAIFVIDAGVNVDESIYKQIYIIGTIKIVTASGQTSVYLEDVDSICRMSCVGKGPITHMLLYYIFFFQALMIYIVIKEQSSTALHKIRKIGQLEQINSIE